MIVVTGGAGFIGSALVWKLNQLGRTDLLVVDELGCDEKWQNISALRFADYLHKDEFLRRVEEDRWETRPEAIVHLGACSSTTERDADFLMRNNYRYTRTLAEWCLARDVRFIYASSAATYGDGDRGYSDDDRATPTLLPLNKYGYSKQLFDLWALRNGAFDKIVGLKFFNVFGPNEYLKADMASVVFKAFHQIRAQGVVRLFKSERPDYPDGGQQRDFIYVKSCVDAIAWLIEHRQVGGLFNLGAGVARTWNDLVRAVFAAMELPARIEYIDLPEALRGRYQYFTQAEMGKLRATGCPVDFPSLEDSVRDYVREHLQRPRPYLNALG
ncbi:MAG: ADP-glyceromanno-heptose 6-epimerase [Planctomycetia bacterium]|nr:ADP-glyceromanno-heptose 6-epimerase [Planctomycetia bacterium]